MTERPYETVLFAAEFDRSPPLYADQTITVLAVDHPSEGRHLALEFKVETDSVAAEARVTLDDGDDIRRLRAALDQFLHESG